MKHAPNVGDRVVITHSQLHYLVGVKATVIDEHVQHVVDCCRLRLDCPVHDGDSNTSSNWERDISYALIEVIEEAVNVSIDIKFSFDELLGE